MERAIRLRILRAESFLLGIAGKSGEFVGKVYDRAVRIVWEARFLAARFTRLTGWLNR